jgi:hypothetical protein
MKKCLVGAAMLLIALMGFVVTGTNAASLTPATTATYLTTDTSGTSVDKVEWRPRPYWGGPRRVVVVRPWHRRPHYGLIVGGIAVGALLAGSYYYAHPAPPEPGMCWYWSSPSHSRGYWDYCD